METPYLFFTGLRTNELSPEAANYLQEEIIKHEALEQISYDAPEFQNVVEYITEHYPKAITERTKKDFELKTVKKSIEKDDYQKAIKGLTVSLKYLTGEQKKNTKAALKGLKAGMKYLTT